MSYSFGVRAASAAALSLAVAAELSKVAEAQPIHERDRAATETALENLLALVEEPAEHEELSANISGSCYGEPDKGFRGVTLNINISTLAKTTS